MKATKDLILGLAILLTATAVRLPTLTAGLPYMSYVDEGHVLHHVSYLLAKRTWVPDTYSYPTLSFYTIAGITLLYSPVYAAVHGRPLRGDLSPSPPWYYDVVEPTEMLVLGRLVTLAFSLGIVLLTGLLARHLAGPAAGLLAAWLAALVPALVARSVIINVNPMAAFFALAALYFAEVAKDDRRPRRGAVLAGVMAGLAGATKYPFAIVCLPVAIAILLSVAPWRERLFRLFLAGGSAIAALLVAMPPLLLRTREVIGGLMWMDQTYETQEVGSYWQQMVERAEWDLPLHHPEVGSVFLLLTAAGLVTGLVDSRWRKTTLAWLIFGLATGLLVAPYKFRAFRNLLALVPVACVLVSLLYARLRERAPRPLFVNLAAAALPAVLFAPALSSYTAYHLTLKDSREQAVRWIDGQAVPRDRVLFAEELVFLPSRVRSLKTAEETIAPWEKARPRIFRRSFHYLVLGELTEPIGKPLIPPPVEAWIQRNYKVVAQFGQYPTYSDPVAFRGNKQLVYILKRVPRSSIYEGSPGAATASAE